MDEKIKIKIVFIIIIILCAILVCAGICIFRGCLSGDRDTATEYRELSEEGSGYIESIREEQQNAVESIAESGKIIDSFENTNIETTGIIESSIIASEEDRGDIESIRVELRKIITEVRNIREETEKRKDDNQDIDNQ